MFFTVEKQGFGGAVAPPRSPQSAWGQLAAFTGQGAAWRPRVRGFTVCLLWCLCFWLVGCDSPALKGDDLSQAREAVSQRQWSLAERLLERYLRESQDSQDADSRWEAWQQLLVVVNAAGQEPRASLEYLETMQEEYLDDDARSAVILQRMAEVYEGLHRYERAVDMWNAYIGLGGLSAQQVLEGYRRLAAMQFSLRRFDAGEDTLQQCLALPLADHDKIMCMYDLADQNMARERWQEVSDLSQQILDSDPDQNVRGLAGYLLADALEQLGKNSEALKQFELARDAYPNPSVIDNRIAHLRKKLKK
ncbi:MAG: hypothetical protein BCS36_01460 [Desulfovibrio sp. MES5]|uniref:tetratricopeptide repeat protein n=1 Tax=Desulfovibrio sp. MES5 TaxID=1899016 RepID=UPI000B9D3144|nr:hypothetical protein [Desulfovibrio sp. MES5]OXS28023.1 MAG: hypothetical protein BCS36_01460 [Desulfovibrio sp. MES5]